MDELQEQQEQLRRVEVVEIQRRQIWAQALISCRLEMEWSVDAGTIQYADSVLSAFDAKFPYLP